ncbi:MAG TPA: hypothetical protein DCK93_15385 [Blastocatellia bacterium]|nr:hypothetical protein [Blastocatellia bacterium]HAF24263.1 hypothetical protein [Blastocatellia bacterium]
MKTAPFTRTDSPPGLKAPISDLIFKHAKCNSVPFGARTLRAKLRACQGSPQRAPYTEDANATLFPALANLTQIAANSYHFVFRTNVRTAGLSAWKYPEKAGSPLKIRGPE